ncbi:hypothetical protein RB195_005077 [Necator americanus]|uniref:SCP domain-containing protein n=1 Tax=Necator americanus TaxID=51031 RepID=A0ABR1BQ80_NECAM
MLVIFYIAVGVLLLPSTLPQDVEDSTSKTLCTGGTYNEEYIRDYFVHTINNHRYALLRGSEQNGPWNETANRKKFPLAKTMNRIEYDCNLEQKAFALLGQCCSTDFPSGPAGTAAIYYDTDLDGSDDADLFKAVWHWTKEISKFAVSDDAFTAKQVVYRNDDWRLYDYLNLVRAASSKIGCADITCRRRDMRRYRAVCLLNRNPLTDRDIIYKTGLGGCNKGETCQSGVCDQFGFCDLSKTAP